MKCNFCSARISDNACFCERCGRRVGDKPIDKLISGSSAPERKRAERKKSVLIPLLVFMLSIAGICLCVCCYTGIFIEFYSFEAENIANGSIALPLTAALLICGAVSLIKIIRRL